MYWIVQDNVFTEPFFDKMISFFDKVDIPYEIVKAVPFTGEMIPHPTPTQDNVFAIGSYSMTNKVKEIWSPGSFTNENYDYRVWSKKWYGLCLNQHGHIYKFKDVPFQRVPFFIRPCEDTKEFTGKVIDWGDFDEWRTRVKEAVGESSISLDLNTDVVLATPQPIAEEYRFIIVDGEIITGSMYKSGSVGLYKEVSDSQTRLLNFVKEVIDTWTPSRAFALDIALSRGEYFVLEMGNVNSAGLYDCDVQKFVMAIENMNYEND